MIVAGEVLVRDGVILIADEVAVHAEAVARCVAAYPAHTGMALLEAMQAAYLLRSLGRTGIQVQILPAFFVGEGARHAGAGQGRELLQIQGENL